MRKSEMTDNQLKLRGDLKCFLDAENWDLAETNWFEDDLWSKYELSPLFDNQKMTIELELNLSDAELNLILTDNRSGDEIFIVLKSMENIDGVFRKINKFKSDIDSTNFREHINSLFDVTDKIFADDGANNLVEITRNTTEK